MRKVAVAPSFERSLKRLSPSQRKQLSESLSDFYDFAATGFLSCGLGFKRLGPEIYEFRVDIRLRVLLRSEDDTFFLMFVGSHEDVRRYLREHR
jgi:mRNA-degrading endonuclease RelE of RelBE toxin-antitoxin system